MKRSRRWLWGAAALLGSVAAGYFWVDQHAAFGGKPDAASKARAQASPHWHDGRFHNTDPMWLDTWGGITSMFSSDPAEQPGGPVAVATNDRGLRFLKAPDSGLRVTWFGHSSTLLELDGKRLLIDPVWSERTSPLQWIGPQRWYPPPLALRDLPAVDAVIISHDHYDHLDMQTLVALSQQPTTFVVPLGVGAHLQRWGIPEQRIVELDWWQHTAIGGIDITATPARHASGRLAPDSGHTLWAGYALRGPQHRIWYSGDTGFHSELDRIGEQLGPFDLTLIEVGQYDAHWPDWHLGPELAVAAHQRVGGKIMLPVHWGLFKLAHHNWTEPAERVLAAAHCSGTPMVLPRPGESIEPTLISHRSTHRWWPVTPWKSATQAPINATRHGDADQRYDLDSCAPHSSPPAAP